MPKPLGATDRIGYSSHISPTQITMYFSCEQKYAYRYGYGMKSTRGASLAIGCTVDHAANIFNAHKLETEENLLLPDLTEQAITYLEAEELPRADEWGATGDTKGSVKDEIPGLLGVMHEGSWTRTNPRDVQAEMKLDFGNWEIVGKLDLIDTNGIVIDYKTAKRSWAKKKEITEVQPVVYTMHQPGASTFRWDIAVRNKTPKLQTVTRIITPEAKKGMLSLASQAKSRMDQIRMDPDMALPTGYGGMLCSKRYCSFANHCQKRWGQPIKD